MATLKINIMSIVAIILMVAGVIAVALYEVVAPATDKRGDNYNAYEAMLIIAIILALVVLIVTCMDVERITGKTFLIYALAALLLLIGIICLGVALGATLGPVDLCKRATTAFRDVLCKTQNYLIASMVFAIVALLAGVAGAVAPFVCNK